jgi:hypothetical protein
MMTEKIKSVIIMKNLKDALNEFQDLDEDMIEYRHNHPSAATDDYAGILSFRSEAPSDATTLIDRLNSEYPEYFKLKSKLPVDIDEGVELFIAKPLSIKKLRDIMSECPDLHVMMDTLRAVSLTDNKLERLDTYEVYDWTGQSESELMGFPDRI